LQGECFLQPTHPHHPHHPHPLHPPRALKTKGNTPKYGLIFHSSFIGRAKQRNKGRISRYLANKCSIASRIDAFMDGTTSAFGDKLKEQVGGVTGLIFGVLDGGTPAVYDPPEKALLPLYPPFSDMTPQPNPTQTQQVEERLRFYEDGVAPSKNITAMQAAMTKFKGELGDAGDDDEMDVDAKTPGGGKKKEKKEKKSEKKGDKKEKKRELESAEKPKKAKKVKA
jgi:nucleolar protein 56